MVHIVSIYNPNMIIFDPYMIIYGPYMIIHGPYMIIYGSYMIIYGPCMIIYGPYTTIYGPYLVIYGPYMIIYRPYVIIYGPRQKKMKEVVAGRCGSRGVRVRLAPQSMMFDVRVASYVQPFLGLWIIACGLRCRTGNE